MLAIMSGEPINSAPKTPPIFIPPNETNPAIRQEQSIRKKNPRKLLSFSSNIFSFKAAKKDF